MNEPAVASLSCNDCEKYVISDISEAKFLMVGDSYVERGDAPTPCHKCPKCRGKKEKNSRTGRQSTLSAENVTFLKAYLANAATFGQALSKEELRSPIVLKRFARIEWILRSHSADLSSALIHLVAARV